VPQNHDQPIIQPRRIGRFLTVDEFGHVQPDVAIGRVGGTWKPLVEFVVQSLMKRRGVRSVYVRGSIPRGLAIENVSDADYIYFSEFDYDSADSDLQEAAKADFPFISGLELLRLDRAKFDKNRHPQRRPFFHMLLKTQSLFLAGNDIANDIEPFEIGPDMVSHVFSLASDHKRSLANEFSNLPNWLDGDQRRTIERSTRQSLSRRIVRSGFEVTMNRSDRFTRDLYLCYEQFAEWHPEWSKQMYQALINCLNGGDSPVQYEKLVAFLANEGLGLCRQQLFGA
jgi:hypothetical protein